MIIYANLNLYIGGQIDTTLLFDQVTFNKCVEFENVFSNLLYTY